jgi:hypothetical protein
MVITNVTKELLYGHFHMSLELIVLTFLGTVTLIQTNPAILFQLFLQR